MKKKAIGVLLFGILFFLIGAFWLGIIYQRGQVFFPSAQEKGVALTAQAQKSVVQDMKETLSQTRLGKGITILFWCLLAVELLCAMGYLICGFSLLRGYSFSPTLIFSTIFLDLLLKGGVLGFYNYVSIPLQNIYPGSDNLLFSYFVPRPEIIYYLSGYLTGLKLLSRNFLIYEIGYGVFIFCVVFYFTRPEVIKIFNKESS